MLYIYIIYLDCFSPNWSAEHLIDRWSTDAFPMSQDCRWILPDSQRFLFKWNFILALFGISASLSFSRKKKPQLRVCFLRKFWFLSNSIAVPPNLKFSREFPISGERNSIVPLSLVSVVRIGCRNGWNDADSRWYIIYNSLYIQYRLITTTCSNCHSLTISQLLSIKQLFVLQSVTFYDGEFDGRRRSWCF